MIFLTTMTSTFYIMIGLGLFLIFSLILTFILLKKKEEKKLPALDFDELILSLGGIENIRDPKREHQRIKMQVTDVKRINAHSLKNLGIPAFLKGKELTLLIKHHTKDVLSYLSERQKEGL